MTASGYQRRIRIVGGAKRTGKNALWLITLDYAGLRQCY